VTSPLRDMDAADRAQLLKVAVFFGPACFVILSLAWAFCYERGWIGGWLLVLLVALDVPLTVAAVVMLHHSVAATSTGLVKTIFAAGDITPPPTYSRQDVLIARGQYAEAADWFRDHIRIEPADHEARLRLAHLLESRLHEYDEAERLYLEIRSAEPPAEPRQQMRAANGLIDLYRKTGRTDRLKVELARFVERHRGTALADGAARELKALKEAGFTSESQRSPT
jgi:tetratricopeptide (TPR) repeat protein